MTSEVSPKFRPFKALTMAVALAFGALAVSLLPTTSLGGLMLIMPDFFAKSDDLAKLVNTLIVPVAGLERLIRLTCIVLFLVWVYRAYQNLMVISSAVLDYSPASAVQWWFAPLINLVHGYAIVRDLLIFSQPDNDDDAVVAVMPGAPAWLPIWWLAFIAGSIFGEFAGKVTDSDIEKFGGTGSYWWFVFLRAGLHFVSALLVIVIVRRVESLQNDRASRMNSAVTGDAPPPVFHSNEPDENI